MKYLNTIEAKGGVLFDAVKDFTFEQVRPGFLYFDDNIGDDSANDASHVVPALKLKVYNTPSTGYAAPSKTNFHYILTSYLSRDINNTGNAVAGGILKATASKSELPLSRSAATLLKKDTSNTLLELRRVNLEQGRITNAQIVPIYDSELVTKKWVESKLGSFTMMASAADSKHLDSATNAEGVVLEASEVDFYIEGVTDLTNFLANPERLNDSNELERAIPIGTNLSTNLITVYVSVEVSIESTKYFGTYRVSNIYTEGPAGTIGSITLEAMSSPKYFKEPTYALSVYELSTDNYSSIGEIRFDLTATQTADDTAETVAGKMMTSTKIAGPKDEDAYARVTCIGTDGSCTFLTYKYNGTAWEKVTKTTTTELPARSYKQVFPDISFIEVAIDGEDTLYKLQLGFANDLAIGAKFYIAYAG